MKRRVLLLLAAGFGLVLVIKVFFPGHMSFDSIVQLKEARQAVYSDWHPPLMAWIWRQLDKLYPGPFGMLLFHNILFWSGLSLLFGIGLKHRPCLAAILILLVGFFPPVFALLSTIWKDVGLGVCLTMAAGLLLLSDDKKMWSAWVGSQLCLFYAFCIRHNSPPAILPFEIWATFVASRLCHFKGPLKARIPAIVWSAIGGVGLLIVLGLLSFCVSRILITKSKFPLQQILLHDLAAVSLARGEVLLPGYIHSATNPFPLEYLKKNYTPNEVVPLFCCNDTPRHFPQTSKKGQFQQLKQKWIEVIPKNLTPYFQHRLNVFRNQMAVDRVCNAFHEGVDPNQLGIRLERSAIHTEVIHLLDQSRGLFFRGYVYALLSLALTSLAAYLLWNSLRGNEFSLSPHTSAAITLAFSGFFYLVPYFFVATTCDFRMHWWTVLSVFLAGPGIIQALWSRKNSSEILRKNHELPTANIQSDLPR